MMKNNRSTPLGKLALSVGVMLLVVPTVQAAEAPAAPQVDAKAYVLMDYDSGKILAEGNADTRLNPRA